MGEAGYTELQTVYDDACKAGLQGGEVDEAARLIELIKQSQRHLISEFTPACGGGIEEELWVNNPQFRLVVQGAEAVRVQLSVDEAGEDDLGCYAVHVLRIDGGRDGATTQVSGRDAGAMVLETAYDEDTTKGDFLAEPGMLHLVIVSTLEPKRVGHFSITTVGMCEYTLEEVKPLVQFDIRAAMAASAFEKLPALIRQAETAGLGWHPTVAGAKLIGDIEAAWQKLDHEAMDPAIEKAFAAKAADTAILVLYKRRYRQLLLDAKLHEGLENDNVAMLLACVDEAKLIDYHGKRPPLSNPAPRPSPRPKPAPPPPPLPKPSASTPTPHPDPTPPQASATTARCSRGRPPGWASSSARRRSSTSSPTTMRQERCGLATGAKTRPSG